MSKYYDEHTLYVYVGLADEKQVNKCFLDFMARFRTKLKKTLDTTFIINLVRNREGTSLGICYVWVKSPEIYNVLTGKNMDGTERYELIDDPNWQPTGVPSLTLDPNRSWADQVEEEEENTCPQIKRVLPPLLKIDDYLYTEEQQKILENKHAYEEDYEVPSHGEISPFPAFVEDVNDSYAHNVICIKNIAEWITNKDIKDKFATFVSNPTMVKRRSENGEIINDTYPYVVINHKRIAFVTFSMQTREAQFALYMNKKLVIEKIVKGNKKSSTMICGLSYKSSRDF